MEDKFLVWGAFKCSTWAERELQFNSRVQIRSKTHTNSYKKHLMGSHPVEGEVNCAGWKGLSKYQFDQTHENESKAMWCYWRHLRLNAD